LREGHCEIYWGCGVAGVGMVMWERSKMMKEIELEIELELEIVKL